MKPFGVWDFGITGRNSDLYRFGTIVRVDLVMLPAAALLVRQRQPAVL